jgi:hypothetical protein
LRYGNAASSSRVAGKPEVILEWCQQGESLIEGLSGRVVVAFVVFRGQSRQRSKQFQATIELTREEYRGETHNQPSSQSQAQI